MVVIVVVIVPHSSIPAFLPQKLVSETSHFRWTYRIQITSARYVITIVIWAYRYRYPDSWIRR